MLHMVLARMDELHRKIEGLALMGVRERVARVLLEAGQDADGEWRVALGTEQIAAMVGASREMVSRVLKGMTESGAVRRERRKLIVLDRSAIEDRIQLTRLHVAGSSDWTPRPTSAEQRAESR
jgi:CRP/FNR family cyclic AMP-dependent transcriptional regulator